LAVCKALKLPSSQNLNHPYIHTTSIFSGTAIFWDCWKCSHYDLSKCWQLFISWWGVTSQKTSISQSINQPSSTPFWEP
jgi:hypothetical protein